MASTTTTSTTTTGASLPERVKRFYERVSTEGTAALAELEDLYTTDIHFINPVVDERGLPAFEQQWRKALRMYKVFRFEDIQVVGDDASFSLTYSMSLRFGFGPVFRTEMATDCHGRDGKVYRARDYFDPLGSILGPFPVLSWVYKKVFGVLVA
jgi:ketosteroid isomerase-like protein